MGLSGQTAPLVDDERDKRMLNLNNRIEVVFLLDVQEGNPNGDPADGNKPRRDPYTYEGLISDACVKRMVRNYAEAHDQKLFITSGENLNSKIQESLKKGVTQAGAKAAKKDQKAAGAKFLCETYWDARMFGAVCSTGKGEDEGGVGSIRGPVQVPFTRSLHPLDYTSHQLTRVVQTDDDNKSTMTGKEGKHVVRYALYRGVATFTPRIAKKTGVTMEDMELFVKGLLYGWGLMRSAARGLVGIRMLRIAQHSTEDGRAHIGDVVRNAIPLPALGKAPESWEEVTPLIGTPKPTNGVTWLEYGEDGFVPCAASA